MNIKINNNIINKYSKVNVKKFKRSINTSNFKNNLFYKKVSKPSMDIKIKNLNINNMLSNINKLYTNITDAKDYVTKIKTNLNKSKIFNRINTYYNIYTNKNEFMNL